MIYVLVIYVGIYIMFYSLSWRDHQFLIPMAKNDNVYKFWKNVNVSFN